MPVAKYWNGSAWVEAVVGTQGGTGNAATISVGTVSTGDAGSNASVTNSGNSGAAVFNFTIPKGDTGATGVEGPLNVQTAKTANYTFGSSDAPGQLLIMNSGSARTFSIPTDATYNFPVGTQINILTIGSGAVNIAAVTPATTTVVGTPGLNLRAQYSGATAIKIGTDSWWVTGDLKA